MGYRRCKVLLLAAAILAIALPSPSLAVFTPITGVLPAASNCSLAWGDFNNDGFLDLAIAGSQLSSIYQNDGQGSFNKVTNPVASGLTAPKLIGMAFCSLAWGDYDNDGYLDLAIAGATGQYPAMKPRTMLYRNNGKGQFIEIDPGMDGVYYCSLSWGDYNNDGRLDLALAGKRAKGQLVTSIYEQGLDGKFSKVQQAGLPGIMNGALAWGDCDNDGYLDLALAGYNVTGSITRIYHNNNGDGTFVDSGQKLPGVSNCSLAWGDYDNDGDWDIALAGLVQPSWTLQVPGYPAVHFGWPKLVAGVYGNEGGTFLQKQLLAGVKDCALSWGDYDGDGDLDLAMVGYQQGILVSSYVGIVYQNNNGSFGRDKTASILGVSSGSLAWGDYDNNGTLDLALAGWHRRPGYIGIGGPVGVVYRNDSNKANTPPTAPTGLAAAAVSGGVTFSWDPSKDAETSKPEGLCYNLRVGTAPGASDLLCGSAGETGLRRVPGIGNAQKRTSWTVKGLPSNYYWSVQAVDPGFAASAWAMPLTDIKASELVDLSPGSLAWGRFSDDGHMGLVVTGMDATNSYKTYLYRYDGSTFKRVAAPLQTSSSPDSELPGVLDSAVAWGDYDGDGRLDLALAGMHGSDDIISKVFHNEGGNKFTEDTSAGLAGVHNCSLAWGDYDNDGKLDLALAGQAGNPSYLALTKVYHNDGGGVFTEDINANLDPVSSCSLAWGDYDKDGFLDLAISGRLYAAANNITRIYRNKGGGQSTAFENISAAIPPFSSGSLGWSDFDSNGTLDLAIVGSEYTASQVAKVCKNVYVSGVYTFPPGENIQLPVPSGGSLSWSDLGGGAGMPVFLAIGGVGNTGVYQYVGQDRFATVAAIPNLGTGTLSWADYDKDGDPDLAVTGFVMNTGDPVSRVYRNNR